MSSKTTKAQLIAENMRLKEELEKSSEYIANLRTDNNEKEELILKLSTRLNGVVEQLKVLLLEV